MRITGIDHVQLAMPRGEEARARAFYSGLLGLVEVPKPAELAGRGGAWFEGGSARVHLGVEADFRPARKAHPGFVVEGFEELIEALRAAGEVIDGPLDLPEGRRAFVSDPFGNRIELVDGGG